MTLTNNPGRVENAEDVQPAPPICFLTLDKEMPGNWTESPCCEI